MSDANQSSESVTAELARWSEPATKGDVIRGLAYVSTALGKLAQMAVALRGGNQGDFDGFLVEYLKEAEDIQRLMSELEGSVWDGK